MDAESAVLARAIEADEGAEGYRGPLRILGAAVGAKFVFRAHLKLTENLLSGIHGGVRRRDGGENGRY